MNQSNPNLSESLKNSSELSDGNDAQSTFDDSPEYHRVPKKRENEDLLVDISIAKTKII